MDPLKDKYPKNQLESGCNVRKNLPKQIPVKSQKTEIVSNKIYMFLWSNFWSYLALTTPVFPCCNIKLL